MGHRWAYNVAEYIGGGTYATLCSPLLLIPDAYLVNVIGTGGFADVYFYGPPGTGPEIIRNPLMAPDPLANFPYGFAVQPDAPM